MTNRKEIFDRIQKTTQMKRRVMGRRDLAREDKIKWKKYYDGYLNRYKYHLSDYNRRLAWEKRKRLLGVAIALVVVGLLISVSLFYLLQKDIFFAPPTDTYTQTLNLTVFDNITYNWQLENQGILQAVSVSGLIEGEGVVKVYLRDNGNEWLILDSFNLEVTESRTLTGFVVEGDSVGNQTLNETNASVEENNITINQTLNETNITIPMENITVEENVTEGEVEGQIPVKEFSFYCEETCDLSEFNLSSSSYELRIEISNASLVIEDINYEIKVEEVVEEVPENVTEEPEINISKKELRRAKKVERKLRRDGKVGKEVLVTSNEVLDAAVVSSEIEEVEIKIEQKDAIKVYNVEKEEFVDFEVNDSDNDGYIDEVKWIVENVNQTIQTFEVYIEVLNVQSYPTVGGTWEVRFTTIGKSDLYIRVINGTTWSNVNEDEDLKLLEVRCGGNVLDYEWINGEAVVRDYECDGEGTETSLVLTPGKHHLEFEFGGMKAWANNFAGGLGDDVIQVYATTFGQNTDGLIAINLDGETRKDAIFTHTGANPERVQVDEDGLYKISYNCHFIESGGTSNRLIVDSWIRKNGATQVTPSRTSCYIRNTVADGNRCSNQGTLIVSLTNGEYLELMSQKRSGAGSRAITTQSCWMYVQRVNNNDVAQIYSSVADSYETATLISLNSLTYEDVSTFTSDTTNYNIGVDSDGLYKIYYHVCSDSRLAQNNRHTPWTYLRNTGVKVVPSDIFSYIRDDASGNINCEVGYTLQSLTVGDEIDIIHQKFAQEGNGPSNTIPGQSWLLMEKLSVDDILMVYESGGGQLILNGNADAINFDTNVNEGDWNSYSHTSGTSRIDIDQTGYYEISYTLGWEDDGGNDRYVGCGYLRLNGASTIIPSTQCDYSRGDTEARRQTVSGNVIIELTDTDYIELMLSSSGSFTSILPDSTIMTITPLDTAFNNPPNQPDGIYYGGGINPTCPVSIDTGIELEGFHSGQADSDGDLVDYYFEAFYTEGSCTGKVGGACSECTWDSGLCNDCIPAECTWDAGGTQQNVVFSDDGEGWSSGDCASGNPWDICTPADGDLARSTNERSGIYSIRADDFDSPVAHAMQKTLDLSSCDRVYAQFYWYGSRLDDSQGDHGRFSINDGSWNTIFEITQGNQQSSSDTNPSPAQYSLFSQELVGYDFSSPVTFSWSYMMAGAKEVVYWDELEIRCETDILPSCSGTLDCSDLTQYDCGACSQCEWAGTPDWYPIEPIDNHPEGGSVIWDTSTLMEQSGINFRVSATDPYEFSTYFTDICTTEISHGGNLLPSDPTGITCNGNSCARTIDNSVTVQASGSIDPNLGDTVTYYVEAFYDDGATTDWRLIGSHSEGGEIIWDTSLLQDQTDISFRAWADDGTEPSGTYLEDPSPPYLEIDHFVNSPPAVNIKSVDNKGEYDLLQSDDYVDLIGASQTPVEVVFDVIDSNGWDTIDDGTLVITYDGPGGENYIGDSSDCTSITNDGASTKTYYCELNVEYIDSYGTWSVTIDIQDTLGASDQGNRGFQINMLREVSLLGPGSPIDFGSGTIYPEGTNVPSLIWTRISNDGNFDIPGNAELRIKTGQLCDPDGDECMPGGDGVAQYFQAADQSDPDFCTLGDSDGVWLRADQFSAPIPGVILPKDTILGAPYPTRDIQFCIKVVPSPLSAQDYSTNNPNGQNWEISIVALMVAIIPARRRKKKKDKLLEQLDNNLGELIDYVEDENVKVKVKELLGYVREDKIKSRVEDVEIPLEIFKQDMSPAEALSKYLKENLELKFSEIAIVINRDQRTVWINYRNAIKKRRNKIKVKAKQISIPIKILGDRKLSVLESIVREMKSKGFDNSKIAQSLGKSPSNVWTINVRAKKKFKNEP